MAAQRPHQVHQLDLVGPRYLSGGERFYGVQRIEVYRPAVALAAGPSKQAPGVVEALVAGGQKLGLPRSLQVDNELSCRGANRHPRRFGLFIRLGLSWGVEVVLIPAREPWRHGSIERFNHVDAQRGWSGQTLRCVGQVAEELPHFERFHHTQPRDAKLGQRTPWEGHRGHRQRGLSARVTLHRRGLPWREGRVSCLLTDDAGQVRFFSESFLVDAALVRAYVKGTIATGRSSSPAFIKVAGFSATRMPSPSLTPAVNEVILQRCHENRLTMCCYMTLNT